MKTERIYIDPKRKVYTSLARACRYGNVLPNYVQPLFRETTPLVLEPAGFIVGSPKTGNTFNTYFAKGGE